MNINGKHYRTIWMEDDRVTIIDQRLLPHEFVTEELATCEAAAVAIADMHVRGAGLIGATAGYGMLLAAKEAAGTGDFDAHILKCANRLKATRPTAVNLAWAVDRQLARMAEAPSPGEKVAIANLTAAEIADEDAAYSAGSASTGNRLSKKSAAENPAGR